MIPLIVFGCLLAVPVLLALIFRVNAVFVFISVCVGYFLQFSLSDDVDLALATLVRGSNSIIIARFVLLLLPLLITLFLMRKSLGKSLILQIVPLIFTGALLSIIALPLLPPEFEDSISDNRIGNNVRQASDVIMAAAVVSNLALVWTIYKPKRNHKKH